MLISESFHLWISSSRRVSLKLESAADGKSIYAWNPSDNRIEIVKVRVDGGKPRLFITLSFENVPSRGISITPDRKRIVCAVDEIQSDVWIIENFDPDVK